MSGTAGRANSYFMERRKNNKPQIAAPRQVNTTLSGRVILFVLFCLTGNASSSIGYQIGKTK